MNNEEKKCNKCGKTLVGNRAIKRGYCDSCFKDTGRKVISVGGVLILVGSIVLSAIVRGKK